VAPAPAAPPASAAELDALHDDFVRLCAIESPSLRERPMADALTADLRGLGLEVEEDDTGAETGSDSGNLLARMPGPEGAPTILLCAHMDTVPLDGPVDVELADGVFSNRNEAILGADNKAAVAVIMALARRYAAEGPPVSLEFLFTTCEELAMRGAKVFDTSRLRSDFGFVFDHATPIGELIVAAPTYYRIEARYHGAAAHAGISPEDGRNAIVAAGRFLASVELGRLDEQTTANAGVIQGGTAGNVVAERCRVELETRSLDDSRAAEVVSGLVDAATAAASETECDLETEVQELFRAYRLPRTAAPVEVASRALEGLGIEPQYVSTGGGSDAHMFIADGLTVLNVANATQRPHQPDEAVTADALDQMLNVAASIVATAAGEG
jgi:tripeptide aminopeptidase